MNKHEKQIVDNIININIKKTKNLSLFNNEHYSFILVDEIVKWKETDSSSLKTIANKITEENSLDETKKEIINENVIKVRQNTIKKIVVAQKSSQESVDEEKTKLLQKTIETFFAEGGKNLHIVIYKSSLSLPENYKYKVAINLIPNNERKTKIEELIQHNSDLKLYWILSDESNKIETTENVFYLECGTKLEWLAHPAAYLSNLSLKNEVKDYCYTTSKTIIPEIININFEESQKFTKNNIVNIAGKGVVLGGELANGDNLVNNFIIDMFEEKLKTELFNILINKPKRNEVGALIDIKLSSLLDNLYNIGVIETATYKKNDYVINYNNKEYTIVQNGELINKGYKYNIVNILESTEDDYNNHMMTPINIVLMTQKQVRFIKLNMEVN